MPLTLEPFGRGLYRPECVIGTPTGDVFVSDWRGGISVIHDDGSQASWLPPTGGFVLRPNGMAKTPDGSFLVAHLGETGGVYRVGRDLSMTPVLLEVDGVPLPPTNFVTCDPQGRLWISVSTRLRPRQRAWRPDVADGFIVLLDQRGARIVADGLHYANEVRPDPTGRWCYVVETFGRRVTRFPIGARGDLGAARVVLALADGCFPDGFAFDEEGGLWITSLVSNRLLRFHDAKLETLVEDLNTDFVREVEDAFAAGTMEAKHLGPIPGTKLQHLTSVAFGGPDRRTGYLGSLHGQCLYRFRSPVAGR